MTQPDVDPAEFRQLCGHFATGVVVITATGPDGQPAGMTANSFASVSLAPPLISINVDHAADMHAVLGGGATQFAINILSSGQEALSRRFAGNTSGRFDGIGYRMEDGFVLLDGALAVVTCASEASFEAGDHHIYIGRVKGGSVSAGRPLLYYRGGYVTAGLP